MIAQNFAENGIIIELSPKFKGEINNSRHLDVGQLGLSEFDNEEERLVKFIESVCLLLGSKLFVLDHILLSLFDIPLSRF